jgi:hypothetical protein
MWHWAGAAAAPLANGAVAAAEGYSEAVLLVAGVAADDDNRCTLVDDLLVPSYGIVDVADVVADVAA